LEEILEQEIKDGRLKREDRNKRSQQMRLYLNGGKSQPLFNEKEFVMYYRF
jgi:hypothetical protein